MREICRDLQFPEGPIAMPDGSIILVEIKRQTLSRISADGQHSIIAHCGGGPNGAALGPDGRVYICNNGGFTWGEVNGLTRPMLTPDDYVSGSIQAVDIATGAVETLYSECDGTRLKGPNDIVFDAAGGFYFTDLGKRHEDALERGAVYYATPDGSSIQRIVHPIESPNGIGLSPDGRKLYVAETFAGCLRCWDIESPGRLGAHDDPFGVGPILYKWQGYERLDSLAVDSEGNVCVATARYRVHQRGDAIGAGQSGIAGAGVRHDGNQHMFRRSGLEDGFCYIIRPGPVVRRRLALCRFGIELCGLMAASSPLVRF